MMEPVDDLVYSKNLRKPKGDITLFSETAHFIHLATPPLNSSLQAGKELLVIQGSTFLRTPSLVNSIKKHDKDPAWAIKRYMDIFGLDYDADYIEKVIKEAAILIKEQKNKFNRPRPIQLAPYFAIQLEVLGSKTGKTPAYPSGHTTQSHLIAEIYGEKYPHHRQNLLKAASECGAGRISGGFHYPSDHRAGILYARRLFKALKSRVGKKSATYDKVLNF